jgi:23S rRNA pseudouridine1911/1915/1917 synthase
MPLKFIVPEQKTPIRLDKFLIERFPHTSRHFWRKHLNKYVRVDGKAPAKGQMLKGGEVLLLREIPATDLPPLKPNPALQILILFEDEFLFAVDKPAGLPCLPAGKAGQPLKESERDTVVQGVLGRFPNQAEVDPGAWEAGLIHRLDNETSGVLLFAKNAETKRRLSALNREGKINKEYLAWVEGVVEQDGVIDRPIAHHPKNPRKMWVATTEPEAKKLKARPALTQFQVLKKTPSHSLLRVGIHRGARHQIRVHLASRGHPVVGDSLYGSGRPSALKRHLLHASEIFFHHPYDGKKIVIRSPAPKDFHPCSEGL